MSSAYRISVEALTGVENYPTWAVQMMDILNDLSLDDHIVDDAKAPSDASLAQAWKAADRKALTQIRLRVASHIVIDIASAKTALDAWTTLKTNYSGQGGIGTLLALRKLFGTRALVDTQMEAHIRAMKRCNEDLRTSGYPLDPKVFSLALLASVPDHWDNWAAPLLLDSALIESPSKVTSAILMEARRRDPSLMDLDHGNTDPEMSLAHVARSQSRKPRSPAQHSSAPTPSASATGNSGTWQSAVCHRCGGKGHIARICPSDATPGQSHAHVAQDAQDDDSGLGDEEDFAF